jgi:hypothetical protein
LEFVARRGRGGDPPIDQLGAERLPRPFADYSVSRWPSSRSAKVDLQDFYLENANHRLIRSATREDPTTEERLVLAEFLEKAGEGDHYRLATLF